MTSYQAYDSSPGSSTPYTSARPDPNGQFYPPGASRNSLDDEETLHPSPSPYKSGNVDMHAIVRTPSPTPSEAEELTRTSLFDWKAMSSRGFWFRREWLWYYVIFIVALIGAILFTVFHNQIITWLQPAANWMHGLKFGWLIPIAILFVISFPPLFGHEIIGILCGVVWGLGIGFAIVCAGTFLGELGNFYAFKYCCAARGEKLERTELRYACLAKVVREGGIKVALIARFSAIPGHFSTAVFSTCGMSVWTFIIAAILSLPKQFITVYLGVALEQSDKGGASGTQNVIKDIVLFITVIVTFVAMWYIYNLMIKAKPAVIYERRKARQAKLMGMGSSPYGNDAMLQSTASVAFNPAASDESQIPLTARDDAFGSTSYQQWDAQGHAVGYAGDPRLYVPQPQRAPVRPFAEAPTYRPQGQRTDSGASMGSAHQMNERGGYQAAPMRSDSNLTNPFAQEPPSPPPSRPTYMTSPPPIPPPPAPASSTLPQPPHSTLPLQAVPVPQQPYSAGAAFTPPAMANPYGDHVASPPPSRNPYAPGYGSTPSSPVPPTQNPYTRVFQGSQVPGSAPLPPSYATPVFAQQQQQQSQQPHPGAHAHGGYPMTYESSTSMQSQASSLPPSYSDLQ